MNTKFFDFLGMILLPIICVTLLTGCTKREALTDTSQDTITDSSSEVEEESASFFYINGKPVNFAENGTTDLDLLSVEKGITIEVKPQNNETIKVNGKPVENVLFLDISAITRSDLLEVSVEQNGEISTYIVNLMPSGFTNFTVSGQSKTEGDYYLSSYDKSINYIFKVDNQGNLIFYKKTDSNALDFKKQTNSNGEIRYTYMPYLEGAFCGIGGINPGCVVVMDENYNVIDELYYKTSDGEEIKIDPHGFIYLDDDHYILTAYKDIVVENIPKELNAQNDSAYLAVLYIQEIKNGEVLWEFCSQDYEQFLLATTEVDWSASTDACYDYVHFNSMAIDTDNNLLVSGRNINSILKISREDGSLIWTLGGKNDEFNLTEDQLFSKQHSIIVTEDGSYMIFNNGNDEVARGFVDSSSIMRFKVNETTKTITEYLEYETGFFSDYMGAIREIDAEERIYLWAVGGNLSKDIPLYSMVEYSETDGPIFTLRFNDDKRRLYSANKCK